MQTIITGPVTVIGKNIDTDQIYPGRYLALTDPKEIGSHCLSGLDENIAPNFQKGGLIVAETNFGCGSCVCQKSSSFPHLHSFVSPIYFLKYCTEFIRVCLYVYVL